MKIARSISAIEQNDHFCLYFRAKQSPTLFLPFFFFGVSQAEISDPGLTPAKAVLIKYSALATVQLTV